MTTAVDTNILLDVLLPDAPHAEESEVALTEAATAGALVVSEPVYAELAAYLTERSRLKSFLQDTGIRLEASNEEVLRLAGEAWGEYRQRRPRRLACPECGTAQDVRCSQCAALFQLRQHVVADFVIGAHAMLKADSLLTRDRGYYSTYFPELALN